jgi:ribosome-associated heat shock protein Hsp15
VTELESLRLDKWLWAARFFKTRKLATDAVAGGKVHVDGNRCKPSKEIKVGNRLLISKDQLQWEITIVALNEQRRPAVEAVLLYQESVESLAKRQQQIQQQREERQFLGYLAPTHKPNKKDRRLIHRFKGV